MKVTKVTDWLSARVFNTVHRHNLVYNTCWEDPRLDREALQLGPDDTVLVITSAGCNALDYALQGPRRVHAVDMNPRQNALLELKIAGIRKLDFDAFFCMFGKGALPECRDVYRSLLRQELSQSARIYWDRRIGAFSGRGRRPSFYFYGTSGLFAWLVNVYIDKVVRVRDSVSALLNARSLEEQRAIYDVDLAEAFWGRFLRWAVGRDATLSMLGVPRPQRVQLDRTYPGGIVRFIEDRLETVMTRLPIHDNYFWRVYLEGSYTPDCCPEYLKPDNFERLKAGLVDRVDVTTSSILKFLQGHGGGLSRFVLLDHMDWLSTHNRPLLQRQWQTLLEKAAPTARLLWRSAALQVDFIDPLEVSVNGRSRRVGELLTYHRDLAEQLHARDRVHTYGSFYIADLAA